MKRACVLRSISKKYDVESFFFSFTAVLINVLCNLWAVKEALNSFESMQLRNSRHVIEITVIP